MCRIISDLWIARKGNIKKNSAYREIVYACIYLQKIYSMHIVLNIV